MFRIVVVGLLLAVPLVAADDGRPDEVVRAAIVAAGGADILAKYPAGRTTAKGVMIAAGIEAPVTIEHTFHVPARSRSVFRTELKGQKQEIVQVVNGEKMRTTLNGATIPTTDAAAKEVHMGALVLEVGQLTPLLTDRKFTLKHDASVRGGELVGVIVHTKGLPDLRLAFDRKSGHLVRIVRRGLVAGREPESEQVLGGHKSFDGLIRPTTTILFREGVKVLELTAESFTPLEKVDAAEFSVTE